MLYYRIRGRGREQMQSWSFARPFYHTEAAGSLTAVALLPDENVDSGGNGDRNGGSATEEGGTGEGEVWNGARPREFWSTGTVSRSESLHDGLEEHEAGGWRLEARVG